MAKGKSKKKTKTFNDAKSPADLPEKVTEDTPLPAVEDAPVSKEEAKLPETVPETPKEKPVEKKLVQPVKEEPEVSVRLEVFLKVAGPKWDQMAGFRRYALSRKMGPLPVRVWREEFQKFKKLPTR